MRPDGVSGASEQNYQPSLTERIDAVDTANTNKNLSKDVDAISTDVNKKIQEFFSQGSDDNEKISTNEKAELGTLKSSLMNLYYKVRSEYVKAENEAAQAYKKMADNLLSLIQRTTSTQEDKNTNEVASLEPNTTDAQNKVLSESQWLDSVSDSIKDIYLRICEPEKYQGHGGPLNVAQKSNAAKAKGLQGLLNEYRNVLTTSQQDFLQKTIKGFNELAKLDKEEHLNSMGI